MGSFANSIFNLLLGWVRTAAQSLWALISGSGGSILTWLGENWLVLTAVLCVACTLVDVLVHVVRWRPYKVWASFLRRITGQERRQRRQGQRERRPQRQQSAAQEWEHPQAEPVMEPAMQERGAQQAASMPESILPPQQQSMSEQEQAAYRSRFARPQQEDYSRTPDMEKLQYQAIRREEPPAPQGLADYPQPAAAPVPELPPMPASPEPQAMQQEPQQRETLSNQMRRRMSQLQKNLGITGEEDELNYRPAQPIVDEKEMYHEPVYPPNWQGQPTERTIPRRRRQHRDLSSDA